jgi:C-terminal processing protease CtpA/Prc
MEINIGDVLVAEVTKADRKQPSGLKIKEKRGKFYVEKISGLFKARNTPLKVGDQILDLNGKDVGDYKGLSDIKRVVKEEVKIRLRVVRLDPDRSESSGSESPVEEEPEETIPDYLETVEKEPEEKNPDYLEIMHY